MVCYSRHIGMALQMVENPDGIATYLIMNQTIYSEQKRTRMVDVYSGLADTILKTEHPDQVMLSDVMPHIGYSS